MLRLKGRTWGRVVNSPGVVGVGVVRDLNQALCSHTFAQDVPVSGGETVILPPPSSLSTHGLLITSTGTQVAALAIKPQRLLLHFLQLPPEQRRSLGSLVLHKTSGGISSLHYLLIAGAQPAGRSYGVPKVLFCVFMLPENRLFPLFY